MISEGFSIRKSTRSKKNSRKIKSTKHKKTKNTKWSKSKWCQSLNGLKISRIKSMLRISKWSRSMRHWSRNFRFRKKIRKFCLNNFWWKRSKMLYSRRKFNSMKNSWIKSAKKCSSKRAWKNHTFKTNHHSQFYLRTRNSLP